MNGYAVCSTDLYIPKLLYSNTKNRLLTFRESLSPPFDFCFNNRVFSDAGVSIVENSADEIREVVCEMLRRREGSMSYAEQDLFRQNKFRAITSRDIPGGISSSIGNEFIKRYEHLLSDD